MKRLLILPVVIITALLAGCGPDISGSSYTAQNFGTADTVLSGVITQAYPVKVGSSSSNINVGSVGGAVAGGVAGSAIGGGTRANLLGGVGGALVGGLLGNAIDKRVTTQQGFQYIVRVGSGKHTRNVSIVQGAPYIPVGTHVNVIMGDGRARIQPAGY